MKNYKFNFEFLIPTLLFMFVIGRKGVAYLQVIPGLYFAEFFLLAAIVKTNIRDVITALKVPSLLMTAVLFVYGLLRLMGDLLEVGAVSITGLKNFALVYYPMAALVGYAWAMSNKEWIVNGGWLKFLGKLFFCNGVFSLAYPFSGFLSALVWNVTEGVPILFTYSANTVFLPAGLFFFFLVRELPLVYRLLGIIITLTGILLLMERAVFISTIAAMLGVLYFSKRKELKAVLLYSGSAILFASVLIVIFSHYIESSRVAFSLDGYMDLFLSIFIDSDIQNLSGTKGHRLEMWEGLLTDMAESNSMLTYFFGKGFNLEIKNVLEISFRSPHNSFLHIFWRTGIVGLLIVTIMMGVFFLSFANMLKSYVFINKNRYSIVLWAFSLFILMLTDAMFGTLFESPFSSAPLFFIIGVCLMYGRSFRDVQLANCHVFLREYNLRKSTSKKYIKRNK